MDRKLKTRYFFKQLLRSTLLALLPTLALLAYLGYDSLGRARQDIQHAGLTQAREAARNIDRALEQIYGLVDFLVARDEIRSLDVSHCSTLLAGFQSTDLALLSNVAVLDTEGRLLCTSNRTATTATSFANTTWFKQARQANARFLSEPLQDTMDDSPGLVVTNLVRNDQGAPLGMVVAVIDVAKLAGSLLRPYDLPEGSILSIIDKDFRLMARNPEGEKFFGTKVRVAPQMTVYTPQPVAVHLGVDNVQRFRTVVSLTQAPWQLFVGIPVQGLLDAVKHAAMSAALVLAMSGLMCFLIAWYNARRLAAPVQGLVATARRFAAGEREVQADQELPGEFGYLAAELNVMVQSITQLERDRAEGERIRAENEAKNQFLALMSHELRTPLNALLGFTQLLQQNAAHNLDQTQRHQLDLVRAAGQQLSGLIDDVLDMARIEGGHLAVTLQDCDPVELVRTAVRMSESHARTTGVSLEVEIPDDCPWVHTDPLRLQQVLLNLLSNAIKYNREGGEVRLTVEHVRGELVMTVADNGIGMSPQQLAKAFEPFNRLGREASSIPGTGLGLPLTRELMNRLQGTLELNSQEDLGTTARVHLPLATKQPLNPAALRAPAGPDLSLLREQLELIHRENAFPVNTAGAASVASPGPRSAPPASKAPGAPTPALRGTILYIEDVHMNVELVQALLAPYPHVRLEVAKTGGDGLTRSRELHADLILLDMRLPDMTGLEVLKQLRAEPHTRAMPVVALSASAFASEIAEALAMGANDYWPKPIQLEQFQKGLRQWMPSDEDSRVLSEVPGPAA